MAAVDPRTANSNLPAVGRDLYDAVAAVAHHLLRLFTLESQLAALSLSTLVGLMVVVALLVSSTWLLLMFAGVVWLVNHGLSWEWALLAGAGVNILLGLLLLFSMRGLSQNLRFSATRQQLSLVTGRNPDVNPDAVRP